MKTGAANQSSGGWGHILGGLVWLTIVLMLGFRHLVQWQTNALLDAHGRTVPAVITNVKEFQGENGSVSYGVHYTFDPPGALQQEGELFLNREETTALLGTDPRSSRRGTQRGLALYLPEDPSRHRLEGAGTYLSPVGNVFGLLFLGGFAAAGVGLIVSGVRMCRPDPPASALPSEESLREPGRRVQIGCLTYLPQPQGALFRPTGGMALAIVFIAGPFGLVMSCLTLVLVAWAFNTMFGWEFLGLLTSDMSHDQVPAFFCVIILAISLLLGLFAVVLLAMVVDLVRFWRHPTRFDYAGGGFWVGGREMCRFSDIRAVILKRITDPDHEGRAKVLLLIKLCDESVLWLAPDPLLARFYKSAHSLDKPFTYEGKRRQEAARLVAGEVATRIGVPLQECQERGQRLSQTSGGHHSGGGRSGVGKG